MNTKHNIPAFVSVMGIGLGIYDLLRGFMHTVMLDYSASHIAGLTLNTPQAVDLLKLLGAFGVSNYITGVMLILLAVWARPLALAMMGVIPAAYGLGYFTIRCHLVGLSPSTAKWGGFDPLLLDLAICLLTFFAGVAVMVYRNKNAR